ncbi:hypothetical protein D3C78_892340 [compost metagenome]
MLVSKQTQQLQRRQTRDHIANRALDAFAAAAVSEQEHEEIIHFQIRTAARSSDGLQGRTILVIGPNLLKRRRAWIILERPGLLNNKKQLLPESLLVNRRWKLPANFIPNRINQ